MVMTGKRHDFACDFTMSRFDDTGRLSAMRIELASRCGMSLDLSLAIHARAMFHADTGYFHEHVEIVSHRFKTHTVSATAFRGFGVARRACWSSNRSWTPSPCISASIHSMSAAPILPDPAATSRPNGMTVEDFVADRIVDELRASSDYDRRPRRH